MKIYKVIGKMAKDTLKVFRVGGRGHKIILFPLSGYSRGLEEGSEGGRYERIRTQRSKRYGDQYMYFLTGECS